MLQHSPQSFVITVILASITAIWLRSPLSYLASSIGLGVVWLILLLFAWRFRSGLAIVVVTIIFLTAHQLLRSWLVPTSLFCLVQGLLVSSSTLLLLLWWGRRLTLRFCRL